MYEFSTEPSKAGRKLLPISQERRGLLLYLLVEEEIPWQVLLPNYTQKRGPSNFASKKRALFTSLSTKRRRLLSLLIGQGRELLTMSSCSSAHGRKLTIKKRGWSSSKLQTLTREVWSSLRPSKGNGEPFTSSSETRRELNLSCSWQEKTASFEKSKFLI